MEVPAKPRPRSARGKTSPEGSCLLSTAGSAPQPEAAPKPAPANSIAHLCSKFDSKDDITLLDTASRLNQLLSKGDTDTNKLILAIHEAQLISRLIVLLSHPNDSIKFEALSTVSSITFGKTQHIHEMIDYGVLTPLKSLLGHVDERIRDQAVTAVGNIAGDTTAHRDLLLHSGILSVVKELCTVTSHLTAQRNVVWALSNLCRAPLPPNMLEGVLESVSGYVFHTDIELVVDALHTLYYIAMHNPNDRWPMMGIEKLPRQIMSMAKPQNIGPGTRLITALIAGSVERASVFYSMGIFDRISMLLSAKQRRLNALAIPLLAALSSSPLLPPSDNQSSVEITCPILTTEAMVIDILKETLALGYALRELTSLSDSPTSTLPSARILINLLNMVSENQLRALLVTPPNGFGPHPIPSALNNIMLYHIPILPLDHIYGDMSSLKFQWRLPRNSKEIRYYADEYDLVSVFHVVDRILTLAKSDSAVEPAAKQIQAQLASKERLVESALFEMFVERSLSQ